MSADTTQVQIDATVCQFDSRVVRGSTRASAVDLPQTRAPGYIGGLRVVYGPTVAENWGGFGYLYIQRETTSGLTQADPLTIASNTLPSRQDGSDFTFRLTFSEAVTISADDLDDALMVGGGEVTGVTDVDGDGVGFDITITPAAGTGSVSVVLPATADCAADDLGRASLDDLAILRGEVLRQFAPRVTSGHRRGPSRVVVRAAARVFSVGCLRLPLGVSSTGVGGWAERTSRPRGRFRSADGRLAVPLAIGSIIGSYEQSWQAGSRVAAISGLPRGR